MRYPQKRPRLLIRQRSRITLNRNRNRIRRQNLILLIHRPPSTPPHLFILQNAPLAPIISLVLNHRPAPLLPFAHRMYSRCCCRVLALVQSGQGDALIRLDVRTRVRGYGFLEENAENGDGSGDDGGCGFDAGPDGEFFAVVGEVFLAELDYVDAFYDGADTGSGVSC